MRHVPVVAAVIFKGERMLVCQRPHHKRYGGLWEFPGGKCLPGESLADAARRELREELGVQVEDVGNELLSLPDPNSVYVITFTRLTIKGEPVCHEHIDLYWGTAAELRELPLAPCDRQFVESIRQIEAIDNTLLGPVAEEKLMPSSTAIYRYQNGPRQYDQVVMESTERHYWYETPANNSRYLDSPLINDWLAELPV